MKKKFMQIEDAIVELAMEVLWLPSLVVGVLLVLVGALDVIGQSYRLGAVQLLGGVAAYSFGRAVMKIHDLRAK